MTTQHPPVILFGYDCEYCAKAWNAIFADECAASPFTNKVRLALRLKQIPFSKYIVLLMSLRCRIVSLSLPLANHCVLHII